MTSTIAAIATGAGAAGVGIIRVSGPDAVRLAQIVCRRKIGPHATLIRARAFSPESGELLDDGLLVAFLAPRSFTGEDTIEFHGHGGAATLGAVLRAFLRAGAQPALPGEFSERAFLSGKIDLTRAEALSDLVAARSDDARRVALRQLGGGLQQAADSVAGSLKRALACIEAAIDFPEDVGDLDAVATGAALGDAAARLAALLAGAGRGRALTEGVTVALVGRPNVGKSSLLNALLGSERAIVTASPGTTRDIVSEQLVLGGLPVRALDTAGIRASDDPIEREGIARARNAAQTADVVIVVLEAGVPLSEAEREWLSEAAGRVVACVNKSDLADPAPLLTSLAPLPAVAVSAATGSGLDGLGSAVASLLSDPAAGDSLPLVTRARHEDALRRAAESVARAQETLEGGGSPELIAVDVHGALQAIGELTGEVRREEIIEGIFRAFCIGK